MSLVNTAVLLLNFGEPETTSPDEVVPFLERIFALNAPLMGPASPEQVRERSHKLAQDRAPGLIEEYEKIGGSPLHRQAHGQAEALERELRGRGHVVTALAAMQFTEPSIEKVVARVRRAGADRVVGLPVYPLAGPSTTVAALDELRRQLSFQGWEPEVFEITGWHRHPAYLQLRADAIRSTLRSAGVSLSDRGTRLVFSAHGTPLRYLEQGSRYEEYVREYCDLVATALGAPSYLLGYQNHTNRPGVKWTQPEIGQVIAEVDAERVVVDPASFMHEQSETLAELDGDLREEAEERGLGFHRVRVPHDAPAFIDMLADLVEGVVGWTDSARSAPRLRRCRCRPLAETYCLNSSAPA